MKCRACSEKTTSRTMRHDRDPRALPRLVKLRNTLQRLRRQAADARPFFKCAAKTEFEEKVARIHPATRLRMFTDARIAAGAS